jgi:inosose dehydratase
MIEALEGAGYDGWYVLEQDTILTGPPAPGTEGPDPVADVRASVGHLLAVARAGA